MLDCGRVRDVTKDLAHRLPLPRQRRDGRHHKPRLEVSVQVVGDD
jgi:hypothetical protein